MQHFIEAINNISHGASWLFGEYWPYLLLIFLGMVIQEFIKAKMGV